jgi:hypothetical protein
MAAGQTAREKLVRFLDQAASNPILCASPDCYSAALKAKLEHVQGPTERTRQRYRDEYAGAEEVRGRFRDDLGSSAAQRELEQLRLPPLRDVRDEFEQLRAQLGVGP